MNESILSLHELLGAVANESALMSIKKAPANVARGGCKHCGCFLSIHREHPTCFHTKNSRGLIEFVIVYHGKNYCRACHKFQSE